MLKKIKAQAIAFTLIATLTNNTANAVYPVLIAEIYNKTLRATFKTE